jgi:hypothetical protein
MSMAIQNSTARRMLGPLARLLTLAIVSIALAGCFTSKRPLFDPANAATPLGEGGRFVSYNRTSKGFERDEKIEVRLKGKGYDFIDEQGKVTPATLHPIGKDLFVAQAPNDGGGYDYVVLRVSGSEVIGYAPSCVKQSAKKMRALGIEIHDQECRIDKVAHPKTLFASIRLGDPTSKLVRE